MMKKLAPIAEQLILSGLSLLINIAFIAVSQKEEFGVFSILNSYLLLAVSLQTAVFSVPVTVEISRLPQNEKELAVNACSWAVLPIAFGLSVLSALVLYGYLRLHPNEGPWPICLAFGAAIFATWLREFSRTLNVLEGQFTKSLILAILYSTTIATAILVCTVTDKKLTSTAVFCFIAFASVITSPDILRNLSKPASLKEIQKIKKLLIPHAQWAAPGVLTSWIQNNAYLSVVGGLAGATAAAEIAAARLFIMPYMTGFAGIGRTLVKKFSETYDKEPAKTLKSAAYLAKAQILIGVALAGIFYSITSADIAYLFGGYAASLDLAIWWCAFAGIACAKSIYVMLAQSGRKFRLLFGVNLIAAASVLCLLLAPIPIDINKLAITALIVGELLTLIIVWLNVRSALTKQ